MAAMEQLKALAGRIIEDRGERDKVLIAAERLSTLIPALEIERDEILSALFHLYDQPRVAAYVGKAGNVLRKYGRLPTEK